MGYDCNQALGNHDVTVETVEIVDKAGDMSNPVVSVTLRFEDGERTQKDFYPFKSDKSMEMCRGVLRAMGFDLDSQGIDPLIENPELLKGARIRAVVQENEWQGKVSNQVAFLNAIPKKLDKQAIAKLNAGLRNAKKENRNDSL